MGSDTIDGGCARQISVIVCSLNPRPEYFRRLLNSLRAQTLPLNDWELLVVDNGSTEPLADTYDLSWHPHYCHIREEELGLTPARLRGIKEAAGDLIVFVDDDNVIAQDYLEQSLHIGRTRPDLAVFGAGFLEPEFEEAPVSEVQRLLPLLGIRHVDRPRWTNNPEDKDSVPWGAGLCIRRSTAAAYADLLEHVPIAHFIDRRGDRLFSGGDDLFSWVAARTGGSFGIFPSLRIRHLERADRVQSSYLLRLVHDHAYSHAILRYVLCGTAQSHIQAADAIHIVLHGLRRGVFSMRSNWAAARGAAEAGRDIAAIGMQPLPTSMFDRVQNE